jgi:hypothetical protein
MATRYNHDAERVLQFMKKPAGPHAVDSTVKEPEKGSVPVGNVEVRQLLLSDCGAVSRLAHRFELRYPESAGDRPGQFELIVRRLLSGDETKSPLYVAREIQTRQCLGMLQCVQQGVDDRWYLQYLASQGEVDDGNTVHIACSISCSLP